MNPYELARLEAKTVQQRFSQMLQHDFNLAPKIAQVIMVSWWSRIDIHSARRVRGDQNHVSQIAPYWVGSKFVGHDVVSLYRACLRSTPTSLAPLRLAPVRLAIRRSAAVRFDSTRFASVRPAPMSSAPMRSTPMRSALRRSRPSRSIRLRLGRSPSSREDVIICSTCSRVSLLFIYPSRYSLVITAWHERFLPMKLYAFVSKYGEIYYSL